MILKQIPEDFIVIEIPNDFSGEGPYQIYELTKVNYNTEDAVEAVVKALGIKRKQVSYAGNKDRNAITKQFISLKKVSKEKVESINLKDIQLVFKGYSNKPVYLGDLKGNKFEITIRGLKEKINIEKNVKIPNFYDTQRFSEYNHIIGKALIKRDFEKATNYIIKSSTKYGKVMRTHLDNNPNDYVNALKKIPTRVLQIYLYSYQSFLWNKLANKNLGEENNFLPIPGFGTETKDYKDIFKEEEINERDFILREFPEISMEGSQRKLYSEVNDLRISDYEKDDLNPGYKLKISFSLGKGSYATMVVKHLLKNGSSGI